MEKDYNEEGVENERFIPNLKVILFSEKKIFLTYTI
jgi:hypothetical protein